MVAGGNSPDDDLYDDEGDFKEKDEGDSKEPKKQEDEAMKKAIDEQKEDDIWGKILRKKEEKKKEKKEKKEKEKKGEVFGKFAQVEEQFPGMVAGGNSPDDDLYDDEGDFKE